MDIILLKFDKTTNYRAGAVCKLLQDKEFLSSLENDIPDKSTILEEYQRSEKFQEKII